MKTEEELRKILRLCKDCISCCHEYDTPWSEARCSSLKTRGHRRAMQLVGGIKTPGIMELCYVIRTRRGLGIYKGVRMNDNCTHFRGD